MYLDIQKMYVPQHSENVCTSTFRKCMYLNNQKMYVHQHSENVRMYINIQKMYTYVPLHLENVCTSTIRKLYAMATRPNGGMKKVRAFITNRQACNP